LQGLWTNHGRHARADGALLIAPTVEEAQAAVTLAVTLVHWFQAGLVRRV
jgi:hypothetical protein